jgi:hypothetical protein
VAGKAATAYAALATAAALAAAATEGNRRKTSVEDFNNALLGTAQNSAAAEKALDAAFTGVLKTDLITGGTTNVNTFADALDRIYHASPQDSLTDFTATFFGQNASSGINAAKDAIGNYDKALAAMATSGNFKDSAAGFQLAAEKARENGDSIEDLVELFPAYKDAILENKTANGETQVSQEALIEAMLKGGEASDKAAGSLEGLGGAASEAAPLTEEVVNALEEVGLAADGSVSDIDRWTQALFNAGLLSLSASDASIAYQAAIDNVTESIKTNGTTLDINTEQGRANQSAFNGLAQSAMAAMTATAAETLATQGSSAAQEQLQKNLRASYDDLVRAAGQFGITGGEADAMARKALGIPKQIPIDSWVNDKASSTLDGIKGKADALDGKTSTVTIVERTIRYIEDQVRGGGYANDPSMTALDPRTFSQRATGGRVPGFSEGGRLPGNGPGTEVTDGFLGVSALGAPLVRVDAAEWIINRNSSDRYNRELAAINAGTFPKLPGYADGGRAGREWSAQQLGYMPGRAGGVASETIVNADFTLNQVNDPVTAAHEVSRRLNRLGT